MPEKTKPLTAPIGPSCQGLYSCAENSLGFVNQVLNRAMLHRQTAINPLKQYGHTITDCHA
jgi:hypothetical protein